MLGSQVTWTASSEQSSPQGGDASEVRAKSEPGAEMNSSLECQGRFPGPRVAAALP